MSEALITYGCSSLEEFAALHGLSIQDATTLLNDPDFLKGLQETTKARARAAFHGYAVPRLIEIATRGDEKQAVGAITLLGKLAGEFKAPRPIQVSFDELMKKAQTVPAGPLGGITQITESAVIDAEEDEPDGDYNE